MSVHFYFFMKKTVDQHISVQVPDQGGAYNFHNAHHIDEGSIWARQIGRLSDTDGRQHITNP